MDRSADAFRTISEVADDLNLPQHVLRFWETRFTQIKPLKRGGGRRYYRPDDVELLRAIRHLLYGEGYTIRGVQRILKEQGVKALISLVRSGGTPGTMGQDAAPVVTAPSSGGEASRVEPAMLGQMLRAPDVDTGLSDADLGALYAALAELNECARILHAARG
jgi:hypothetical protein